MDAREANWLQSGRGGNAKVRVFRTQIDVPAELVSTLVQRPAVRERLHAVRLNDAVSVQQIGVQALPARQGAEQCEVAIALRREQTSSACAESALRMLARLKWDATHGADLMLRLMESPTPPRVVVSGSSGAIAGEVIAALVAMGVRIDRLVRRGSAPRTPNLAGRDWWWEPRAGGNVEPGALDGAYAVVHTAAESVMGRWSASKKLAMRESRVEGTRVLARAAAQAETPPRVFISASGAHAYGDRGDETMTEDAGYGSGFLAELVRDWEAATQPAMDAGVRTAMLRIGVVQHARSGAIREMALPFRLGLGVIIGPGGQHWPWVSMVDVVGAMLHVMSKPSVRGPVNVVCPEEATADSFARALARAMDKPLFAKVPAAMLRAAMGEQVDGLIMSTRVAPDVLRRTGYQFALPAMEAAMRWEVGAVRPQDVGIAVA